MPNIGGESPPSIDNLVNGTLYISCSDNHLCITSSWKMSPLSMDIYYYGYLISKFSHQYSEWLTDKHIPTVTGISLLPANSINIINNIDDKAYAIRKYDPFIKDYVISNYYEVFYYSPYTKSLVYVDTNNINLFILIPIQIKDHSVGVFGNISDISNVYMITGKGIDTIKNGDEISLPDGTKYIKFQNHAVKAQ